MAARVKWTSYGVWLRADKRNMGVKLYLRGQARQGSHSQGCCVSVPKPMVYMHYLQGPLITILQTEKWRHSLLLSVATRMYPE